VSESSLAEPRSAALRGSTGQAARTASEVVAEAIRGQIATGQLSPGEMLPPESSLLEQYGVARSTMREALRILESDGLVRIERGTKGGARVQEANLAPVARRVGLHLQLRGADLEHLVEAQAIIQPGAVGLAAISRTTQDLSRLRATVAWVAASEDVGEYIEAVAAFTARLLEATHNPVVAMFWELTLGLFREGIDAIVDEYGIVAESGDELFTSSASTFGELVDLIEAGDDVGAESFWRGYLRDIGAVSSAEPSPLRVYQAVAHIPQRRIRR